MSLLTNFYQKRFEVFKIIFNFVVENNRDMNNKSIFKERLLSVQANLLSFAYKLTADEDDAHDLLQDTTLKALDNESKYVDNVNFKGWIFTIMRNIFINNYRRSVREKTLIDTTEDLYHLNICRDVADNAPDGAYAVGEITRIINSFPKEYQVPFSMFVAGYKYEEVAEILNIPLGTVKSRIHTMRLRLRTMLGDYK